MSPSIDRPLRLARVTLSDRASAGIYEDRSGPAIDQILESKLGPGAHLIRHLLPDDPVRLAETLRSLCDTEQCDLIVTTGGTGPGARDCTPEATRSVLERELPGFGEAMRMQSFATVPTAILTRATAGTRGRTLILNLPGNPKSIGECLPMLVPAIRECIRHLREG